MGWVIMGMVIWFVFFRRPAYNCRNRRRSCAPRRRRNQQSVSETYRRQAEAEDMTRRILAMERALDPRDERLRRDIQNL